MDLFFRLFSNHIGFAKQSKEKPKAKKKYYPEKELAHYTHSLNQVEIEFI